MNLNKNFQPIECTKIEDIKISDSGEIISKNFNDIYFYPNKGSEETEHTFINGNNITRRWREKLIDQSGNDYFVIGETGFGSGLNFLCTWNRWRQFSKNEATSKKTLYYISTELYPPTYECLKKIIMSYNPFPELSKELLKIYPDAIGGDYLLNFDHEKECSIKLILLFGESEACLSRLENYPDIETQSICSKTIKFDAWYLDGFSPKKNPKMWTTQLLQLIARYSYKGTTLATYSSAREVKDKLKDVGFKTSKIKGYGKKREMISAYFSTHDNIFINKNKFKLSENLKASLCYKRNKETKIKNKEIIIIGAGIAGCTAAYLLKKSGHKIKLIDNEKDVAQKASGNLKAILYSRTAKERSASSDFYEASMHFAQQFYRGLDNGSFCDGLTGMIKLNEELNKDLSNRSNELRSRKNIKPHEMKKLSGLDINKSGIFYPDSGWLHPFEICNYLSNYSDIEIIKNNMVTDIFRENERWAVKTPHSKFAGDTVIICCGHTTNKFKLINWLKIKPIRGQTTHLPTSKEINKLKTVLCYEGYITPSSNMCHDLGSSYNINDLNENLSVLDQKENINKLLKCFDKDTSIYKEIIGLSDINSLSGDTGIRSTTTDYMPIVGPISNKSIFLDELKHINKLNQNEIKGVSLIKDLYINTGFGSNGFTTSPLCSEILVSYIDGTPMPVSETIRRSISPNRFLYREQKRL